MSLERERKFKEGRELLEKNDVFVFDLDNVVVDSAREVIKEFKVKLRQIKGEAVDTDFTIEEVAKWGQISTWGVERGLTEEEALSLERNLWDSDVILGRAKPVKGVDSLINTLRSLEKNVYFATSRPPMMAGLTRTWVKEIFPLTSDSDIFVNEDEGVSGEDFKAQAIRLLSERKGTLTFVEDSPFHAEKILRETLDLPVTGILIPLGLIKPPQSLLKEPRLITLRRDADQGLEAVTRFLVDNVAQY